jgi:membrane-associated phospholipid phosphatase
MATSGIPASAHPGGWAHSLASGVPAARTSGAHGLDKALFLDVNHFARDTGWLHTPLYDYATYGVVLFAALLVAGWWVARRRAPAAMAAALWAGAGTLLAVAVAQPLNHAVAEARPWQSLPHALILAGHSTDFSFPSDHAVMAGAVATGLLLYHRRLGIIAAAAGLVLSFARVYIGAHYPQDVAAGLLLGAAVAAAGYALARKPLTALVQLLAATPLRPLLTATAIPATACTQPGRPALQAGDLASGLGSPRGAERPGRDHDIGNGAMGATGEVHQADADRPGRASRQR